MTSGFRIQWSQKAIADLENIINYLLAEWTEKEVRNFVRKLDKRLELISINPRLFPNSTGKKKNVRRSVLTKHAVIYYETSGDTIKIIALFDPRQHPGKLKI